MGQFATRNFILKTSTGDAHNFSLSKDHKVLYNVYNKDGHFEKKGPFPNDLFIDFSLDIDSSDRLHFVGLTHEGHLLYCLYQSERWSRHVMTRLNLKSNNYKNLILKIHGSDIHIFYSSCNLINAQVWSIQHIFSHKNNWDKKHVISFTPGKYISPFYVDFDKLGNIHLIFKDRVKGLQRIFYTTYNSFLNKWLPTPQMIHDESNDQLHPYLFLDKKNTVHVLWCSLRNNNLALNYVQLSTVRNHSSWKSYKLPLINGNVTHPILIEERGTLKLFYKQSGSLKVLLSSDYGHNWVTTDTDYIHDLEATDNLNLIRYASNYQPDLFGSTIRHVYGLIDKAIYLFGYGTYGKSTPKIPDSLMHTNIKADSSSEDLQDEPSNSDIDTSPIKTKKNAPKSNGQSTSHIPLVDAVSKKQPDPLTSDAIDHIDVKTFISDMKKNLDQIMGSSRDAQVLQLAIEDVLLHNAKTLDQHLALKKQDPDVIDNYLDTVETAIKNLKSDHHQVSDTLAALKEHYDESLSALTRIESQLEEVKNLTLATQKESLLKKISDFFK